MDEEIGPWDRLSDGKGQGKSTAKRPTRLRVKLTSRVFLDAARRKAKLTPEPSAPVFIMAGATTPLEPPHMQRILTHRAKSMARNTEKSTWLPFHKPSTSLRTEKCSGAKASRPNSELQLLPRSRAGSRVLSGPLISLTAKDCEVLAALERRLGRLAQK